MKIRLQKLLYVLILMPHLALATEHCLLTESSTEPQKDARATDSWFGLGEWTSQPGSSSSAPGKSSSGSDSSSGKGGSTTTGPGKGRTLKSPLEGVVEVSEAHKVYYKHHPAAPGMPTVVLLNGLIYDIENWSGYFNTMANRGYGVVQVAYSTQPESLRLLSKTPYFMQMTNTLLGPKQIGIETSDLVGDVMAVVNKLQIPRFTLLSLSYGSFVAVKLAQKFSDRIDNLIFVAPAIQSSHRYLPYGQSRHAFFLAQRSLGWDSADYYYDAELAATMSALVTPLQHQFEGVPFANFFSGVFQMARSVKWEDLKDYKKAPFPPTFFFLASVEDPPLLKDQLAFWDLMANNSSRRSLVRFVGAPHALTGVYPQASAAMTERVLNGNIQDGLHEIDVTSGDHEQPVFAK